MPWRSPLADEWRRYLAQQIELGGAEVFLEQRPEPAAATPNAADRHERREAAVVPGSSPRTEISQTSERIRRAMSRKEEGCAADSRPGLQVETPPAGLLGNDLSSLATLEEIAERIREPIVAAFAETAPMPCRVKGILALG